MNDKLLADLEMGLVEKSIKKAPLAERVALLTFTGLATWRLVLRGRRKIEVTKIIAGSEHDTGRIGQQGRQKFQFSK
ncbi:hypothetical protein [Hymenobacter sp. BRD67]|uniref:hypothetical protein n=1 Tax=Hymenobacter sp. BRD67 TaxID=2675877 RepID=UPI0015664B23|nr:hypothetical protein [Hymenobacter sp. BRD67]QKG51467.1 hypothetical protein GKZ67_01285 [Hymenobacter sp. BRD67]